eukprot:Lankesteria_metandrocarpae@DN4503_c0_g1_i1.p1
MIVRDVSGLGGDFVAAPLSSKNKAAVPPSGSPQTASPSGIPCDSEWVLSSPVRRIGADENDNSAGTKREDQRGRPCHDTVHRKNQPSLLSHTTTEVNLRGLLNLLVIVFITQNARLVLENLLKYGLLVQFIPTVQSFHSLVGQWPLLVAFTAMNGVVIGSWATERHIANVDMSHAEKLHLFILQCFLCFFMIALPHSAILLGTAEPIAASVSLMFSITWCLKLISYFHYLSDFRRCKSRGESLAKIFGSPEEAREALNYPDCLRINNMFMFMIMPTVCFQLRFPRTPRIKWVRAIRSLGELAISVTLIKIIVEQYVVKTVENTFRIINLRTMTKVQAMVVFAERVLKLSVPNLIVWLLIFFSIFHHWLNFLAEVTRFADRDFYLDWWNAASFASYWRKWNIPIHNFCNRHINKPLLRTGCPRIIAGHLVFLLSAVAHEYLVVVPLGLKWNGLVFFAFLLQVPLIFITEKPFFRKHETAGNILFWVAFCFTGQPVGVILYYFLWALQKGVQAPTDFRGDLESMLQHNSTTAVFA